MLDIVTFLVGWFVHVCVCVCMLAVHMCIYGWVLISIAATQNSRKKLRESSS